jgi:uncharacterized damage-inducible protein DinB
MRKTKAGRSGIDADTMRPEYDVSNAVRGATAARYAEGTNVVLLEPDVAQLFPDSRAVNEALRTLARSTRATPQDVRTVVDYHYWARDRLLEACAPLTSDQFTRDLSSSFPSVRDTLVHLYTADWGWHLLWQGQSPIDPRAADSFPDLASVRSAWQDQERKVRSFVANLGEEGIGGFWQRLLHLVNHASYHRGQVTTMLRQLGVDAPKSQDMIMFYKERALFTPISPRGTTEFAFRPTRSGAETENQQT